MSKRGPNPRRVKRNRNYSTGDIVMLFGVHKNTVRAWVKAGLQAIDSRKPALFHGAILGAFLEARRARNKHPLRPGQFYCLPCRMVTEPALGMAQYVPLTSISGNLRGLCPKCERWVHRRVNLAKLDAVGGQLEVTATEAGPTLRVTANPSVNRDFTTKGKP